ncbi:MFS transporter [Agrococcus carbonis]|uniref:MFS transporter, MHS family, proline/betaine transporter n=1 Tax=Agrococcus carbonis TaxID=684552 RepID=A0A1H1P920_9MICO|nr:MFS transporter [Agrococcus carbonis]SDS07634.1 MFS transporter, MHS family, proline/betaine transporter [Agrococcus carbonis]
MTEHAAAHPAHEPPPITRELDLSPIQRKTVKKSVMGAMAGNAIEWFDYGIYGYLVVHLSSQIFGGSEDSTLWALFGFAVSFLIRPIGGAILGPLGDRIGRQKVLVFTILMISLATAAIGILPTFEQVGWLAPLLLFSLRIIQGFSAGGEYAGAAVYMAEHAPDDRRGFWGSFLEFGTLLGFSMAAILVTGLELIVGPEGMEAGWWRLPFLLTLPLGIVALIMRKNLHDSETFTEAKEQDTRTSAWQTLRDLVTQQPKQLLKIMGITVLINTAFYLVLTYMPTYLTTSLDMDATQAGMMLVGVQLVMMVVIIPLGALTDRVGRRPILLTAALGFTLFSIPAIMLLDTGVIALQILGLAIFGIFLVMLLCNISASLPALFPTTVRYAGFALGYNVATSLLGGPAGLINESLIQSTGSTLIPGFYMTVAGIIGLIAIWTFNETAGRSLRGDVVPGDDDLDRVAIGEELIGKVHDPNGELEQVRAAAKGDGPGAR